MYSLRSELEGRKCFNFERMPTDLATLFPTLLMWEWKFNRESIKTPKYFALSHDNIGKLFTIKVTWGLSIFCLGEKIRWFDFDGFRLTVIC